LRFAKFADTAIAEYPPTGTFEIAIVQTSY